MELEQKGSSYQATLGFPGNGKRIGAGALWIFFFNVFNYCELMCELQFNRILADFIE